MPDFLLISSHVWHLKERAVFNRHSVPYRVSAGFLNTDCSRFKQNQWGVALLVDGFVQLAVFRASPVQGRRTASPV